MQQDISNSKVFARKNMTAARRLFCEDCMDDLHKAPVPKKFIIGETKRAPVPKKFVIPKPIFKVNGVYRYR